MKISVQGTYGLAAAVQLAGQYNVNDSFIPGINISTSLGISKIFLERVLSNLKRGGIVTSAKGASGGYRLAKSPEKITAWDILTAVESSLFERAGSTVLENSPNIEAAIKSLVFTKLDYAIEHTLKKITLYEMLEASVSRNTEQAFMMNI